MFKQTFRISANILKQAVQSKESLEQMAFCLLIKLTYTNSIFKNATIRRMKDVFSIGSTVAQRIKKNIPEYGYINLDDNNTMTALKLKEDKGYHVILKLPFKRSADGKCGYRLKDIEDLLRRAFITNHISKLEEYSDTIKLSTNPCASQCKQFKKARKKLNRMRCNTDFEGYISYKTLSTLVSCCRTKVKRLIDRLCRMGAITKKQVRIMTGISPDDFTKSAFQYIQEKFGFGSYYLRGNVVMFQSANIYRLTNRELIRYVK